MSESRLALGKVRVLDMGAYWAGPYCGGLLAALGAEVIKIESCRRPDPIRLQARELYPEKQPGERHWNRSGMVNERNRSKLGITLDLTHSQGKEIFKRLVRISDVLTENFSTRVMGGFGLDYPVLKEVNPQLIMVSIASQGRTGPEKDYVSFADVLGDTGGLAHFTNYPGRPRDKFPKIALSFPDPMGAITGACAVVAGLQYRRRTGKGIWIDISQRQAVSLAMGELLMDYTMNGRTQEPLGNDHSFKAPHNYYRCRGRESWVGIAVSNDEEWKTLCQVMGNPPWTKEENFADALSRWQNREALDRHLEQWTSQRDADEVMHLLQAAGVAAGTVLEPKDLLVDPHLKERGYWEMVTHPEAGTHPYRGHPIKLSCCFTGTRRPAPCLGEHNEYIYGELLGMSSTELAELEKEGLIGKEPKGAVMD